ncbi:hypothetical protein [Streptomyces sp. MS2.AVA.5]|uniref:Uncharacterized protein n=1 Tax=Streptomyces achmelvichensis TaxID=3134111 RepID=A0ACC6PKR0_9ACTN
MPWEDIHATYTRPTRTPWAAFRILLVKAFTVACLSCLVLGLLSLVTAGLDMANRQTLAEEEKKPLTQGDQQKLWEAKAKRDAPALAGIFVVIFSASAWRRFHDKREGMREGFVKDGDEVVTEALDTLPALAALAGAPAGRARGEALTQVHEKVAALMSAVTTSTATAAGMSHQYVADRGRLREHGQKVRTAFADKLGNLVEDRETTARELAAMALTVASRQAQAAYGALLDAEALPAEPGPEVIDVKGLRKVFAIAGAASLLSIFVAPQAGAEGAGLLFIPLAVFALVAFLAAAFTRNLHQLGRVFAMFGRSSGDSGGVV